MKQFQVTNLQTDKKKRTIIHF